MPSPSLSAGGVPQVTLPPSPPLPVLPLTRPVSSEGPQPHTNNPESAITTQLFIWYVQGKRIFSRGWVSMEAASKYVAQRVIWGLAAALVCLAVYCAMEAVRWRTPFAGFLVY